MTHLRRWRLPAIVTLLFLIAPAMAEETDRPKVGLVLGGGGARGAAHIGVLKELERMRVPVDAIAGTSMGAIVGGLYATGMNATELEELVDSLDWAAALTDKPNRDDMSFRRKQDDAQVPIDLELGIRDNSIVMPKGVIQGQELDLLLRRLTLDVSHIDDFDNLPIPFRAIASDIEYGEAIVMQRGDLAQAIRASMSVPAVFAPVRIDGRLLVDGGLVRNLPIDVMQAMDVDVIIAVDVEFPLYGPEELDSAVAITEQMVTILMRKETERQIERMNARDILIQPDLGTYASSNFDEILDTIVPGQDATRAQADKLQAIALDQAAWEAYAAERVAPVATASHLAFVDVKHDGVLASEVLESRLTVAAGDPIDHAVLAANADRLYGLQLFEQVSYRLVEGEEGTGAEYLARTKSWGPNILQFGVALEDDFAGSTGFNVFGRITRVGINRLGAEWRNDVQLGTDPKLFSEFYQPLSFDARFFIAPYLQLEQTNINAFAQDETVARYRLSEGKVGFDFGRELGRIGEFRLGVFRGAGEARVKIGDPSLENIDFQSGGAFMRLRFDTLDNARFPKSGMRADIGWTLSRPGLGADARYDTIEGEVTHNWTHGKSTFQVGFGYATTLESNGVVQDYFRLGGFQRLSGFQRGAISGPHAALAKLVYRRQIGESGLLATPIYLGLSLEGGNAWQDRSDMSVDSMLLNGSVFAGFDSWIGPVYLGAGFGEQGHSNVYLFVGAPPD